MRTKFNNQLKELNKNLVEMAMQCENCLNYALQTFLTGESDFIKAASNEEKSSDLKQQEIQALCTKILLTQQPVASDLHLISAALKMVTDLERIADQASDIAELSRHIKHSSMEKQETIISMTKIVIEMLCLAVDSFVEQNKEKAKLAKQKDDKVDEFFYKLKNALACMITESNANDILDFLMIAKYLERIGDHIVNIAEEVESL